MLLRNAGTLILAICCCSGLTAQPESKSVSLGDCRFAANPSEFLARESRIHLAVYRQAAGLTKAFARAPVPAAAADTIPKRNFIDDEIFGKLAASQVPSAPISGDEEFFRRINLDLTGRIPASDEIRAFIADSSASKRDATIDRLLNSPEFTDRWTMWLGDLLQNTSTLAAAAINRNFQGRNAFHAYIKDAVSSGKSFSTIASEVIVGKGNNYDNASGAANYPMSASASMGPDQDTYDSMLVKTATTFLGLGNYDCLLCHNGRGHLDQASRWGITQSRSQAQGMAAFFSRVRFTPSQPTGSFAVSDADSGSYALNTNSGNRPDRVTIGTASSLMPEYRETGAVPSDGNWRAAFAANVVKDPMFARNLANRIWKQLFNLGLVEPVDNLDPARLDPANPPPEPWDFQATHPALLEKLAAELTRGEFHLRPFLRTLVQSSAYQLDSRYGGEWKVDYVAMFARHYARRMEGEEVHDAIAKAAALPGDYAIQGWSERPGWAMQLPEPIEPKGDLTALNFMNTFQRGNRDTQLRGPDGSIQQQLFLMNDAFVGDRVKVARSSKLQSIAKITSDADLVEEVYLTFLSRRPADSEKAAALAHLGKTSSRNDAVEDLAWMCINKVEFLFSH